jgi:hypothetical protein
VKKLAEVYADISSDIADDEPNHCSQSSSVITDEGGQV